MKKILACLMLITVLPLYAQVTVEGLKTENRTNPIGLEDLTPRFSWQLVSTVRNTMQTAYEIRVGDKPGNTVQGTYWATGKINSANSQWVPYGGKALESAKTYYWQVRVWDNRGKASAWSAAARWQTALLQPTDWKASWIAPGYPEEKTNQPSPLMRRTFRSSGKITSATAFITAHGLYEAYINGQRIGDAVLTPG